MRSRPSLRSSPNHKLRLLLPLAAALVLLACLALPAFAQAATVTWTDQWDSVTHKAYGFEVWTDPENWSPQQVPGPGDYVVIDTGADITSGPPAPGPCPAGSTFRGIDTNGGLTCPGDFTLTEGTSYQRDASGFEVSGAFYNYGTVVMEGAWAVNTTVNYGTIIGRQGGAEYISTYPVYNYGNVRADSGTLLIDGGGTGFASGTFGGGAGVVLLEQGSWALENGCAFLGGVDLAAVATIPSGATATCQGGSSRLILGGGLLGPGTMRVAPGATLTLADHGSGFDAGVTLDNDGTVVVNVQNPYLWHGGTLFDNSGLLDLKTNGGGLGADTAAGRAVLVNTGTITSEGTATYIELALDNRGTISVPSGTLALQGGMSAPATGDFLGSGAGRVSFETTTYELADGARLQNVNVNGPSSVVVRPGATVTMEGANTTAGSYNRIEGPGTLRLLSGATLATSGYSTFAGGVHFEVEGTLVEESNTSDTTWEAGTVLDNSGTIDLRADVGMNPSRNNGGGTIVNTGTILKSAGTGTSTIGLDLTNNGTISVPTGRITLPAGVLTNYNASTKTLTGGTYQITDPGLLRINDAGVTTLAANVVLNGAAAKLEDSSARNALRNLSTVTPAGSLQLLGGQALATVALANQGTVRIGEASSLTTTGPYTQSSGRTTLVAPTSSLTSSGAGAAVTFSGGYLYGCGTVAPSLTNTGACLRPSAAGTPYGTLSVAGPYTQGAAGALEIDLGGTAAGQYDALAASGAATLAGALRTASPAGYVPAKGDSFAVLTCASRSGSFLSTGGGKKSSARPAFQFVYAAGGLTLKAT
jgi:hypothetical protein